MNDNHDYHADRRNTAVLVALQNLNIGANGRWFLLALIAIAVAAGMLRGAVAIAILLGLSVILEQLPQPWRTLAGWAFYLWCAVAAIWLLVMV